MPVTLSGAEGPPAGWLRSLGYARDDKVKARGDSIRLRGDKTCERDDKVNLAHVAYSLITRYPLSTLN